MLYQLLRNQGLLAQLYKSRFFIVQKGEVSVRDHTEYEKIIKNQQRIIEVLVQKNKRLEEGN